MARSLFGTEPFSELMLTYCQCMSMHQWSVLPLVSWYWNIIGSGDGFNGLEFGTKPLRKLMLAYCQFDPLKQTSVKFLSNYDPISFRVFSAKWQPFCFGLSLLMNCHHFVAMLSCLFPLVIHKTCVTEIASKNDKILIHIMIIPLLQYL